MKILTLIFATTLFALSACTSQDIAQTSGQNITSQAPEEKIVAPINSPTPEEQPLKKEVSIVEAKLGLVGTSGSKNDGICLRTLNSSLLPDARVFIIGRPDETPQKTFKAKVISKLPISCVSDDSDAGDSEAGQTSYYSLKLEGSEDPFQVIWAGMAILDPTLKFQTDRGMATFDINGDGKNDYFRACTSNEGIHLTVWSGKPLKGKRIWHRYWYLHYATDPTCTKKDFEGTDE